MPTGSHNINHKNTSRWTLTNTDVYHLKIGTCNLNAVGIAKTLSVIAPSARSDKRESESETAMPLAFNFLTSLFKYYSLFLYVYATKIWQNNIICVQNSVKYIFFVIFAPKMGLRRRDTQYGFICFRPCASLFKIIAFAAFSPFLPDLAINFQFSNNPLKHYLKQ